MNSINFNWESVFKIEGGAYTSVHHTVGAVLLVAQISSEGIKKLSAFPSLFKSVPRNTSFPVSE